MTYVSDGEFNPFGFDPDCERFVPGFGDVEADFHVIGDHPGIHGGVTAGVPFTETDGASRLQRALLRGGLLQKTGTPPTVDSTYLSYLHPSVPDRTPSAEDYVARRRSSRPRFGRSPLTSCCPSANARRNGPSKT